MTLRSGRLRCIATLGLIWTLGLLAAYYTFYDQPRLRTTYWLLVIQIYGPPAG